MSYIFLQEQGEVSSVESFSDIPAYVLSRLNLTARKYYCNGNETESCQSSRSGMMCEHSMENRGEEKSMSFAEDSHAKTSALQQIQQGVEAESREVEVDYGPRWQESFARFNQRSRLWKTAQCSLLGGLESFSETWPDWGMMRDGECSALPMPGWSTKGLEFSFMPTITKTQIIEPEIPDHKINSRGRIRKFAKTGIEGAMSWCLWVLLNGLIPTPKVAEFVMGWPMGWTDLQPLEMDKFQQWLNSHGKL